MNLTSPSRVCRLGCTRLYYGQNNVGRPAAGNNVAPCGVLHFEVYLHWRTCTPGSYDKKMRRFQISNLGRNKKVDILEQY